MQIYKEAQDKYIYRHTKMQILMNTVYICTYSTVRSKYLEGENIGEFGEFMAICQNFTLQMS